MTEPTTSSRKGKTGPIQQCKTQFEWASNHIKSQCKVGNRFIGFDHEHLSRKQKVSMTAPTNISVAIPLNTMVILQEEIHTQNAVQVYERKNAMEIDWWNYTQNLYAATFPDQLLKRKLPTAYVRFVFFNAAHSPSRYTIITWVYLVLWILCKFVESSKQIYLIQTKYTHGGFWRSTRRDLDLKELDVYWAFNLLLNI